MSDLNVSYNKHTAPEYMSELVNYGRTMVPRGYAYQLLIDFAIAQGYGKAKARLLADRWMQGYDLRRKLIDAAAKQTAANARLIAAAPRMAEFIRETIACLELWLPEIPDHQKAGTWRDLAGGMRISLDKAEQLLAEIEGQQSCR